MLKVIKKMQHLYNDSSSLVSVLPFIHILSREVNAMAAKKREQEIPMLNTTISEMPVNDVPIDALTRDAVEQVVKVKRSGKNGR